MITSCLAGAMASGRQDAVRYTQNHTEGETEAPALKAIIKAGETTKKKEICAGENLTLTLEVTGTDDYSAVWYKVEKTAVQEDAGPLVLTSLTAESSGQYYCEVIDNVDASRPHFFSDTMTVVVHSYAVNIMAPGKSEFCVGDTLLLRASHSVVSEALDTVFRWIVPSAMGTVLGGEQNDSLKIVLQAGGEIQLQSSAFGCPAAVQTQAIQVHHFEVSIDDAGLGTEVCRGDSLVLKTTGSTATTYSWSGAGITGATDQAEAKVKFADNGEFVIHTSDGVCRSADTIRFHIQRFAVQVVTPSAERGICYGAPLRLTTRWEGDSKLGDPTYRWRGEGIQTALTANAVNILVEENARYVVEAELGVCRAKDSVDFTVHHLQAGILPPVQPDICNGDTVEVEAFFGMPQVAGDTVFTWTAEKIVAGADQYRMRAVLDQSGTVKLKVEDRYCADSTTVEFNIQQFNVKIQADDPDRRVCSGDKLTLRATGTLPALFSWRGLGIQTDGDAESVDVLFGDNGEFVLNSSDVADKCHDTDTIRYVVEHFSGKIIRPEGELTACDGDPLHLVSGVVASETGKVSYRWEGENIQGVSDQSEMHALAALNGKYKLFTSLSRCQDADSLEYTVHSFRAAIVPPVSRQICYGDTVVLHASHSAVSGDTTYLWTAAEIIGRNDLDSVKVVMKDDGRVTFSSRAYGCEATDALDFTIVHYQLKIETNQTDREVCRGSELTLVASNAATVIPGSRWTWSGDGVQTVSGTNTKVKLQDNGKFYLEYSDGQCRERDSIEFAVRKYEVDIRLWDGGDLDRCRLDTVTLLASNRDSKPEGGTYAWKGAGAVGDLNAGAVKVKLDENGEFSLRAFDGKCYSNDTVKFRIHKYDVGIRQPEQWPDICRGTELTLSATNAGTDLPSGATYLWSGEGLAGEATAAEVRFVVGAKAEYALKAFDGTCYTYDTLRFSVQEYKTGIQQPSALAVCYGDRVTLQATDLTGDSYAWSGAGLSGDTGQPSVDATLTDNGIFTLHTTKGVCTVDDRIEFTVKKYNLSVPASQVLPEPQKLTLRAAKEANSVLDWYVNNTHAFGPSASETAELNITANSQVKVVMTMNADKCTSTAFCNVRVGERDSRKYHGGEADGFAISRPSLRLRRKDTTACVNTTVIARLQTILFDGYNYEWFQVGREDEGSVCSTPNLYIARCRLDQDGEFYCQVKDAEGEGYLYSDTLTLTVNNGPVARIGIPAEGTDRCYGEEFVLQAESVAAGYTYEWTGLDITGGALSEELRLRALKGGLYTLKVSDGSCSSVDSIRLQVQQPLEVDIPDQINLTAARAMAFTAWTNIPEGEVTWNWGATTLTGRGPVTLDLQQSGTVYATLNNGRCAVKDSCRVYIKAGTTFVGGDADGFDESVSALRVAQKEIAACTGEEVTMDVTGWTAANCKYEWFLVGNTDRKVSDERSYRIDACTLLQAGDYYCQATNGDRQWRSDTLTLAIEEGPIARIVKDDASRQACFGEQKEIQANPVSGHYEWSGDGIIAGRFEPTVTIKANAGGTYVLKVTEGSCSTTDTLALRVIRPEVVIPDLAHLAGQGNLEVEAERNDPQTEVKWYINNSYYITSREKVTLPMENLPAKVEVRADVVIENCPASDTMLVFIKQPETFTAGPSADDGFSASRPALKVEQRLLQPCPTEDLVMRLRADVTGYYGYVWYKVDAAGDVELGKGTSYEILKCTNVNNGEYYCKALRSDEAGDFFSDTVTLEVSNGVIAALSVKNDDRELCYGEDLIFTAQPSGSMYTYTWSGPGVASAAGTDRLEMKAGESGKYMLTVSDGKCESTDTLTIRVTRLSVDMAATRFLNEPQTAQFTAITPEETVMWYIGENLKKTAGRVEDLDISGNCRVRAQVEALGCVDSAVCEVFVKKPGKVYVSGTDDGFAESKPELQVEKTNLLLCQGQEAVLAIKEAGYVNYVYKWYKDLETEPVHIGREYIIPECRTTDEGLYYCKVTKPDADDGEEPFWVSPKVSLKVTPGPFAVVRPLASAVCYGSATELDASETGFSQSGQAFDYVWSGPGADGQSGAKISIEPTQDACYIVKVSDAATGCSDTASVWVKVNHVVVEIEPTLTLAKPQAYRFKVYNPSNATLEWYIDDVVQGGDLLNLERNCVVKVKATLGNCEEYASCSVIVRQEELYVTTPANGNDDGFAVSLNPAKVRITPKELEVCTANPIILGLEIAGEGFYHYKWYRTDRDGVVLSEEKEYKAYDANANMAGQYYCIVENLMMEPSDPNRFVLSDTATVTFTRGPRAIIGSPLEGTDICNGVEVTLDASDSEKDVADAAYTYEWFGAGADGLTGKQITFIPLGEQYVVKVSDGHCSNTDTLRLHMNSPEIVLPEQLHLNEGRTIVLTPEKPEGTRINWYVDNNLRLPNNDIGRLDVTGSCKVVAEVVKNVTGGTCSGYDTTWVYVKTPSTFTSGSGDEDGFAATLPQIRIRQLPGETDFCRGTPIERTLSETLAEKLLKYEWRKVGSVKVIFTGKDLVIPRCEMSDTGRYYCAATDLAATGSEQKIYYSDTVKVNVLPGPVAKISSPVEGETICYQAPLDLDASETEIGKYPYTDVYEYLWTGEFVKAPTLYHTQANPENSGRYILQVTNGVCTTYDTVSVVVKVPDVQIQRTLFIDQNGEHRFVVDNPGKGQVNWYVENTLKVEKKDTADIMLVGDCNVIVEMVTEGCRKTDTCLVFKKIEGTFMAGGGEKANDDGFYASGTSFYIDKIVSTELVCNGATSVFTISVVGNDFYRYAWKKKGNPSVLSNERTFRIERTTPADAGAYYCEVTDVSNNNTQVSNEVTLEVIELPQTKILTESREICEGSSVTLSADQTLLTGGQNYTYLWSGTGLAGSREPAVTFTPRNSGRYVLTISEANCFTKDTVDITVVKQSLKVPKVFTIKAGEDIAVKAEVTAGTNVNWRVNNVMYNKVNPLVLNGLKESVTYVAEADGVCAEKVTGNIFVRTNAGYAGGEDDGFTMPNGMPQIIDHSPEIVGCGVDTASLFVELLKKDEKVDYIWQKYDENKRDYVPFEPGAPEGHVSGLGTERIHFAVITADDEGRYRCRIKAAMGYINGPVTNLVKGTIPQIDGPMNDIQKCEGKDIIFLLSASVNNGKDPQYRWYYSETPDNFRQLLPEQDLDRSYYELNGVSKDNEGYYMTEVYNLCGSVYDTAFLEIWQKPTVVRQSGDTVVCLETPVRLWVEAAGGGTYGYSLYQIEKDKNGKYLRDIRLVYRGLDPWYDMPVPSDIDQGDYVWTVWNECDSTRHHKSFHLEVEHSPEVNYSYLDTTLCIGTRSIVLDAKANVIAPGASTCYRWTKDGTAISQKNASHVIDPLVHADTGIYKCYAYNACPEQLMKEFRVHKKEAPLIDADIALSKASYCEGEPIEIGINYTSDAGEVTKQWYFNSQPIKSGDERINGALSDTLQIDSVIQTDGGRYYVILHNSCGNRQSNQVTLTVDMPARFAAGGTLDGKDQYLCLGDNAVISVTATGKEPIDYTWTKDGNVVNGARTSRLQLSNVTLDAVGRYCCYIQNVCNRQTESTCDSVYIITPQVFQLAGAGKYCGYEAGREVTLSDYEPQVTYQLYRYATNGSSAIVATVKGEDVPEGGTLSFGTMPAGRYYAMASAVQGTKLCNARMEGEIEIIRDITPAQYDFMVASPICAGGSSGSLILKGSENDATIEYTLQRASGEDSWNDYGRALPGTGGPLTWNNLAAGVYRVQAVSTLSGCALQIGEADTLKERPYPKQFDLIAQGGDTTNCQFMEPDVALELAGAEQDCEYTLWKDGVSTDRTLNAEPIVWEKVEGSATGTVYTVKATTKYGCSIEMGSVKVVEKKAPESLLVKGGGYYCSGDTDGQEITIEGKTQVGVKYDIYQKGGAQLMTDTVFYGTGKPIVFVLPNAGGTYYVRGVDTLDGCVGDMQNEFIIREDSLKIMPIPEQTIPTGTSARLYADIRNAVNEPTILWKPEELFATGGNTVNAPQTVRLKQGQRFIVTVDDGYCTAEAEAVVRLEGADLYTEIKLQNCLTDADTLRLCEGETVNLCSWTDGGKTPYSYQWLDKNVAPGRPIGTKSQLSGYAKAASGYLHLEVTTEAGQFAQDSIWIAFEPKPRQNLAILHQGLNCALVGEEVEFVLQHSEEEVAYTLEYSADSRTYQSTGKTLTGDGTDLTFGVNYAEETAGYYRLLAEKTYKGGNVCRATLTAGELRQRPQRYAVEALGDTEYCADTRRDSIRLLGTEAGVTYRLVNTSTKRMVDAVEGDGEMILFAGYFGSGRYRVVGQLGACTDSMNNIVSIHAIERPLIGKVSGLGVYCTNSAEPLQELVITKPIRGAEYALYRDSVTVREKVGESQFGSGNAGETIAFSAPGKAGNYFIVSQWQDGMQCTDTVRGLSLVNPPKTVKLKEESGMYCYAEGGLDAVVKIYDFDPLVDYELKDIEGTVVGTFDERNKDTLYCRATLKGGKYYVWSTATQCSNELGMYTVEEHKQLADLKLLRPLTECDGYELTMGVQTAEKGITYELYEMVNEGLGHRLGEEIGNGSDLVIGTQSKTGTYVIRAVDPAGCEMQLSETYTIGPLPEHFDMTASATEYCAGDAGVVLGLSGTQAGMNYWLQRWDPVNGEYVKASASAVIYGTGATDEEGGSVEEVFSGKYRAGKYRVVTGSCHEQVMGAGVEITEIPQPLDIPVTMKGKACVDSLVSVVLTGTEPGIRYVIMHDATWTGLDTLVGNGRDTSWTFTKAEAGIYSVYAIRKDCVYPLSQKVVIGVPAKLVALQGYDAICANETATLTLAGAETTAEYQLWGKNRDTLFEGRVSGADVVFNGVVPGDSYVVIARNEMCETMSSPYDFQAKELPVVSDDNFVIEDCSGSGKGDILLHDLNSNYLYTLVGPDCDVRLLHWNRDSLLKDRSAGEYCLTVQNLTNSCVIDPICKNVRRALPADSILLPLNYCAGNDGMKLKLSGSTYNVRYSMLQLDETLIETVNYPVKAFVNNYAEGRYLLKKENLGLNGGCVSLDTIQVNEVPIPSVDFVVTAGTGGELCEKGNNRLTLELTEPGVEYVLRLDGTTETDTLKGDGGPLTFEGWKKAGKYEIIARRAGSCQALFAKNWKVNPVPSAINAQDGTYCYDPASGETRGASIFVKNLDPSAKYYFCGENPIDSIAGLNSGAFKLSPAGEYVITGIYEKTGCRDTVKRVKITEISLPDVFVISNLSGDLCDVRARIRLSGSEEGVMYSLYMNDNFLAEGPVMGTGGPLDFSEVDAAGTFKVYAQREGTECGTWMEGTVVIASEPPVPQLEVRGVYCVGETSSNARIALLNPVKGWTYFISRDLDESKRVKVNTQTVVEWDTVGARGLLAGEYTLNGINECGDLKELAKATVKAMPSATPYKVECGDVVVCDGKTQELVLENSDLGVSYQLKRKNGDEISTVLPEPVKGTGGPIGLGEYGGGGLYYVEATVDSSQCRRLVDTLELKPGDLPASVVIVTPDTCVVPGNPVAIKISGRRQPHVDYYLYLNGVPVDTISRFADPEVNSFEPRYEFGFYDIVASNEAGCTTFVPGISVAEAPDDNITISGGPDTTICSGGTVEIRLDSSQLGMKYVLEKNGMMTRDTIRGTGEPLLLATVSTEGVYRVWAVVSSEIKKVLKDTKQVIVKPSPELDVDSELGYCAGGEGVEILVRNTKPGIMYDLYLPNGSWVDYFEGDGGDQKFKSNSAGATLFKKGRYRIKATDSKVKECPTNKELDILEVDLPEKQELSLMGGSKYMCEYPEIRTLVLANSQVDVEYSLYRRSKPGVLAATVQEGNGKALSFQVQDTGVYYVAARSMIGDGCASEMANEVEIVVPDPIQIFDLSSIKSSYCDTAKVVFGSVKLSGSEPSVNYELYRDGQPTGLVTTGNRSILKWSGLKGKPTAMAGGGDADGYIYTVNAVNQQTGCSRSMTGQVSMIEETQVLISRQDPSLDVCMGSKQTLHVIATGGMLNYQWKKDGHLISTDRYYTMDSITDEDIGVYQCYVSNQCGHDVSANIDVNVRAVVIQDKKMEDVLICEEPADVRISSTAVAEGYKWYRQGDDAVISEKQTLELTDATGESDAGYYVCYAYTTCGGIYDTCRLEFNRKPEVVWKGDVAKTLCAGSVYEMQLESRDTVRWYRDGLDLNVSGNVYAIDSLETGQAGLYTVVASNKCSSSLPIPVQTLYVDEPIEVVSVTDSLKHYCKNSMVTLEITTKPAERVTYKWYRAGVFLKDGVGNKHQFAANLSEQNMYYEVRYSNACTDPYGPPTKRGWTIRIDEAVKYDALGAETKICAADGALTDLRLKAVRPEGETYRWYYSPDGVNKYLPLEADTVILPLENKREVAGYYYCDITNACETASTDITQVIVDSLPVITLDLADTTICEAGDVRFEVKASGGNLTYTWKRLKKDSQEPEVLNIFKPQGFDTESLFDLQHLGVADDSCLIWCEVVNPCSAVYSDTAVVRVVPNATVLFEQNSITMCEGFEGRVVVRVDHGALPATYGYTINGGETLTGEMIDRNTDTLVVSEVGTYQLVSLSDNGSRCVDKNPVSALEVAFYERYTATLSGNFEGCIGTDAEFTISIDRGEGPWKVELIRESDGKPADEIGEFPMTLTEAVTKIQFKPTKNEHYRISQIVETGGSGCAGQVKGVAATQVHQPNRVAFSALKTDRFGGCANVDFNVLLRPSVSGGFYYIDNKQASSTALPAEPGKYHIVYVTRTAYGCEDSARVDLIRDTLPKVTLTCDDELCPGESTDLKIHVDGTGPFTVTTNMKEINLEGRETFFNNLRKRTDANGDCSYNIFNNNDIKSRTYEIVSVTDKYGCGMDPALALPKKVVTMRERPLIKVETKHALYNNGAWSADIKDFVIPDKGTVTFRVTELRGGNPWNLSMERIAGGASEVFEFPNNKNTVVNNIQATDGEYRFTASDNYCSMAEELTEVRNVKYTEAGYLKIKVMLEGAYSNETGTMVSRIEDVLPRRELAQLPEAGEGRQWIDWVVVELRKSIGAEATLRDTMLLRSDGYVTDLSGNELLTVFGENFSLLEQNAYYVVIKHRNHLPIASVKSRIYTEADMATLVDLTDVRYIYSKDGDLARHMKELNRNGLKPLWGMAVGNVLENNLITVANPNEIQRKGMHTIKGYYLLDVNFDGLVKWAAEGILETNQVSVDEADDAYVVYKNRNLFSEIQ